MDLDARLAKLGVILPQPPAAIGNFVPGVVFENILYIAGTYGNVFVPVAGERMPGLNYE